MSIDAFEKREQLSQLRAKILQAEQERIEGESTLTVSEARTRLRERFHDMQNCFADESSRHIGATK